ncbi:MAG: hypothetical protein JWM85_119 [Acidimicrobiaceae bacterium]|nr:hypothetical protein [Acidimicrobiaceae bacterium]
MAHGLLEILRYFLLALIWLFALYGVRTIFSEGRRFKLQRAAGAPQAEPLPAPGERQSERRPVFRLKVLEPAERRGLIYELGREITMGRSPGCTVPLEDDTYASSLHARVFARDGEAWLEDLGSTNGTHVNDRRIGAPVRLRRGDRVRVGGTVLEVVK